MLQLAAIESDQEKEDQEKEYQQRLANDELRHLPHIPYFFDCHTVMCIVQTVSPGDTPVQ